MSCLCARLHDCLKVKHRWGWLLQLQQQKLRHADGCMCACRNKVGTCSTHAAAAVRVAQKKGSCCNWPACQKGAKGDLLKQPPQKAPHVLWMVCVCASAHAATNTSTRPASPPRVRMQAPGLYPTKTVPDHHKYAASATVPVASPFPPIAPRFPPKAPSLPACKYSSVCQVPC